MANELWAGKKKNAMDEDRRWKVEDAMRNLEMAEKHKADPDMMKDVKKMAKEKIEKMKKVISC